MCGVCGVFNHPDAAFLAYLMTFKLQHRGQQAAGIAVSNKEGIDIKKGLGFVADVFERGKYFDNTNYEFKLEGTSSVGHVRYSTQGEQTIKNAQPFAHGSIESEVSLHSKLEPGISLALSYNGNLANAANLKRELEEEGETFSSTTDTEIILKYLERNIHVPLEERIRVFAQKAIGSYSIAILEKKGDEERLVAVRDSRGFMPLVLGKLNDDSYVVASESRPFRAIKAKYVREVEPGEILSISHRGLESTFLPEKPHSLCVFQYVYFSMPDSNLFGQQSAVVKQNLGRQLAMEDYEFIERIRKAGNEEEYIVISMPDSGNHGALGYAHQSGLTFQFGFDRDHNVGREFIGEGRFNPDLGANLKLDVIEEIIRGKRVVVVDDSVIRGNTVLKNLGMLKASDALEIHLRIASPPYANPCFYGIDTPSWNELVAANFSVEEIRAKIGVDSLRYLSIDGLLAATTNNGNKYCAACFTGKYPTEIFVTRNTQPVRPAVFSKA